MTLTTKPAHALAQAMAQLPLIAILRGLTPAEAPIIGEALVSSGFAIIEVPLNSPEPLQSIAALTQQFPQTLIGAGTVLNAQQVKDVHAAGGRLVVAPNFNTAVVAQALALNMVVLPGVATPTEAFAALDAGANGLKLFPAEMISPATVKALRAVLPKDAALMPVGGITPHNMAAYLAAGASGFGLGSALFAPGRSAHEVRVQAEAFVRAFKHRGASLDPTR
ncbi:2-dehydro-3-deoxy-6-phosphogalactonate aldolase [Limnohabitans planktonicus]|uniref:2-dehydro-3-deoxy-6-phosphogalactonate aldolase n=1 Tax=Limnohabitans planktonicus II-D5 TaxID=1293045 RepID=A0A2T7UIJ6_9BURK|nr:2-dehydro-3-deoxy-6-phosphogalactonate aldolase [Limnohabitans planktonicus]PVE44481.1 2-dehydro-3-deoxy-6-phosphogalactonate aldolase [Limnohabitans planktonicus II-D5]